MIRVTGASGRVIGSKVFPGFLRSRVDGARPPNIGRFEIPERVVANEGETMEDRQIQGYRFLVTNPDRLGGKPTVRGTRFSVSFILACLAEGMSYDDIVREYSEFPRESIPEVLRFAAEIADRHDVAA
jgi:uncharacterized protein (DUF433 family)